MVFNERSRQKNAIMASSMAVVEQIASITCGFIYRTIFLAILSKEYLGIEGVFSNILQLFSLAELGIGTTILYRMYKPFSEKNINAISAYMHFYKNVYRIIAVTVFTLGACLFPFVGWIVNSNEIPGDVNLQLVYVLFVLQSVASYLFVYKQSVIQVNQQGYLISGLNILVAVVNVVIKSTLLFVTKKYELVLLGGILSTVLINGVFSLWISNKFKEIFRNTTKLTKEQKLDIAKDTSGVMCHRLGFIVLTSTDNVILTKVVGLAAAGIYANYSMISNAISNLVTRMLNCFIPTIGNFIVNRDKKSVHDLYQKLIFANFWVVSFCTVCLFVLFNPFIELWLDESFLFSRFVVVVLCAQFFIKAVQTVNNSFIEATGLFVKDRVRPLIESALNLIISIVLAKYIGTAGVFIGTCVSSLTTCFWRQPFLLYKYVFKESPIRLVKQLILWIALTCGVALVMEWVCSTLPITVIGFAARTLICFVGTNIFYAIIWHRTDKFHYFYDIVIGKLSAFIKRG